MRVLITGHNGYIGSVLVPLMLAEGYDIVGLDTDLFADCIFLNTIQSVPAFEMDVRDITVADLEGFDAVIHLAALSNDPLGNLNPDITYAINHRASVHLAKVAREAGVSRFLFSSSCSTYGAGGKDFLTEEAEFNPVTPYGTSKVLVEHDVSKLANDEFSPVFLRNATAYGVSPRMRFDLVLNNLAAWATTTGRVHIKSDGSPWRPIIHIEDISRAFIAALQAPREAIHNQAFNVGKDEENYQIRDLAEIVHEIIPNSEVEFAEGAQSDTRTYRVDFGKIQRDLPHFEPQWNARRGVEELYDAYLDTHLTLTDFEGKRFRRIDHIKRLLSEGALDSSLRWVNRQQMERTS